MSFSAKKSPKLFRRTRRPSGASSGCAIRQKPSSSPESSSQNPKRDKRSRSDKSTQRNEKRRKVGSVRSVKVNIDRLAALLSRDLDVPEDMPFTSDMSLERVERISLYRSFLKKFEGHESPDAEQLAIDGFLERNRQCGLFDLEQRDYQDDVIDGEVKSLLHDVFYWPGQLDQSLGLAQISAGFGIGPGANVGCEEKDFLTKVFHSPLACTHQDLYTYYVHAIRGSTWASAEKMRMAHYGLTVCVGSRLLTVPKNVTIRRVISPEPPLNMLFQKGIGKFTEGGIFHVFGIDLSRQPEINRELARLGSIDHSFGTMDLKDASNCVSVRLCKLKLPPVVYGWMMLARSPCTTLPDGTVVKLEMMSTMGNAFTFPLQTAIFAAVVVACYHVLGIKTPRCDSTSPTYGVFGDDIIVRREAFELVARTLRRYGFVVNDDKSFNSGNFRESCGGDYWCGHLVRGVYIKRLADEADVYSAINRLIRWSTRSGVKLDFTMTYLLSKLRKDFLRIPFTESDTGGVKTSYQNARLLAQDWFTRSDTYRCLVPKKRSYAVPGDTGGWAVDDGHIRSYNGDALVVALVGGYIRDGRVSLREEETTRYQVRWRSTPFWGYIPSAEASQLRGGDWNITSDYYITM